MYKRQLEVLDDDGKLERKADMFHKRTIKQQRSVDLSLIHIWMCIRDSRETVHYAGKQERQCVLHDY